MFDTKTLQSVYQSKLFQKGHVMIHFVTFLHENVDEALKFVKENVNYKTGEPYTLTGVGSAMKRKHIENTLNIK